jgi:hypothetical protein
VLMLVSVGLALAVLTVANTALRRGRS